MLVKYIMENCYIAVKAVFLPITVKYIISQNIKVVDFVQRNKT